MADPVSLGITVALTAANMAITASRKIEGPRLSDLGYTGGDYGSPLSRCWGHPRVHPPVFFAEDLKEVKRRRKTKGGKYNDYTYYATFAFALAGHEIAGLRKLWLDGHLALDFTGVGPVSPFGVGSTAGSVTNYFRLYRGTDDQEADPRILATTEARNGEGSCPAYRDTAYGVLEDLPVEKFGNRVPQVIAEIACVASTNYPTEEVAIQEGGGEIFFSPDFSTLYAGGYYGMTVIDTAARAVIAEIDGNFAGLEDRHVAWEEGSWLASVGGTDDYYVYSVFGTSSPLPSTGSYRWLSSARDGTGTWHYAYSDGLNIYYDGVLTDWDGLYPALFNDLDGNIWIMVAESDSTSLTFRQIVGGLAVRSFTVTGLPSGHPEGSGAVHYRDDTTDRFVFSFAGTLYAVSTEDGTIEDTYTAAHGVPEFRSIQSGISTIWAGLYEIALKDLTLVRSIASSSWGYGFPATTSAIYDPINHALVVFISSGPGWLYLDRVGSGETTLGTVVRDVSITAGIDADEIDTSDLTQTVAALSVGAGSGKDWLEPLLDIHDSDARPHDFVLEFLRRGAAPGAAVSYGTFAQPRDDSALYETPGAGGSDLPALVTMQFADLDADQQPALASSGPLGEVDSERTVKLDMSNLGLDATTARQILARWHRRRWFERQPYGFALSMQSIEVEPADVNPLALPDGRTVNARLTSAVVGADRTIALEWRPDDPSLAALDGADGASFDGRDVSTIAYPLLSKGFVLDVPLLEDADSATAPQVYPLAAPVADGAWPGAVAYQAIDGEYSEELASIASADAATWGTVVEALPYANPNLWDRGTTLTVKLKTGTLSGCSEAAANANPRLNQAVIGIDGRWEVVQFTIAVLTAPLTYTISGFKRGRRGTEWAAELHAAGDFFALVGEAEPVAMNLDEVGTDVSFKAITAGRMSGFPFGYMYEGQSLRPYAPVHLEAVKDAATGDWTFTWVRRTRIGGAWTSGTPIPLGEVTELYELTLGDGITDAVKSPTTGSYTWSAADQVTDTGSDVAEGELAWSVAQVSDAIGAGFVAVG